MSYVFVMLTTVAIVAVSTTIILHLYRAIYARLWVCSKGCAGVLNSHQQPLLGISVLCSTFNPINQSIILALLQAIENFNI